MDGDGISPGQIIQVCLRVSHFFAVKIDQKLDFVILVFQHFRVNGHDLPNLAVVDPPLRVILQLQDPVMQAEVLTMGLNCFIIALFRVDHPLEGVIQTVDPPVAPVHSPQNLDVVSRKATL